MRAACIIAGLVIALLSGCFAQADSSAPVLDLPAGSAVVIDLKGEVTIQAPNSSPSPATKGQVLSADTTIETGKGRALLQLQDGTQILVRSRSRAILRVPEQASGNFLETLLGKVLATVTKRIGKQPAFRMGTPTAVITVRGTRFLVEVSDKPKTLVSVYEGLVEVAGLGSPDKPVLLAPGFSTGIGPDQIPETPQKLLEFEGGAGTGMGKPGQRDRDEGGRRIQGSEETPGDHESPEPDEDDIE